MHVGRNVKILLSKKKTQSASFALASKDKSDTVAFRTLAGMWDVPRNSEMSCAKEDILKATHVSPVLNTKQIKNKFPKVMKMSSLN